MNEMDDTRIMDLKGREKSNRLGTMKRFLHKGGSIKMFPMTQKLPWLGSRCLCFYASDLDEKQFEVTVAQYNFIDYVSPPVFCDQFNLKILSHVFLWGYLPDDGIKIDEGLLD